MLAIILLDNFIFKAIIPVRKRNLSFQRHKAGFQTQ